ncbi:MAG: methyltransferase domain-containing protein [Verrucomicrobiota bacterium]
MSEKDRKKWDARYRDNPGIDPPSFCVKRYFRRATVGRALDLACGNGRNSLFLAEQGFDVDAVDISRIAIDRLEGRHPRVHAICDDLDTWTIPPNRYELILNIRFLDRRLFPHLIHGLKPGGLLILESYIGGTRKAYTLEPNELLQSFSSLRIIYYEEKKADHGERFDQAVYLAAVKPD